MSELHSVFTSTSQEIVLYLQTKPEKSVRQTQFDLQILVDLGVHAPSTNAKELHRAQDLGKGDQERKVGFILESDPRDI